MSTRRTYLKLLGVGATASIAGCSDDAAPADSESTATTGATDMPPAESTAEPTEGPTAESTDGPSGEPTLQTILDADDGDSFDHFGDTVDIDADGTTVIVGAPDDENLSSSSVGSAYLFAHSDGSWAQTTKLVPDEADIGDNFGQSVAVSGDGTTVLVGADGDEDPNGEGAGSAYVFVAENGSWTQQAKLIADDGDSEDGFGRAVTLDQTGSVAIIGAPDEEDPYGSLSGSAYAFSRDSGVWFQRAKLTPDDLDEDDQFGTDVSLSADGTTALLGAPGDEDPNGSDAGSVYVFTASNTQWGQATKLSASNGTSEDDFGTAVALSGDGATALVGTPGQNQPNGTESGSAYVFTGSGASWSQETELTADDGDTSDALGSAVRLSEDGSVALAGAPDDEDPNGEGAGSAYLFSRTSGSWEQLAKIAPENGDGGDAFGLRLALAGDGATAAIGARFDADQHGTESGAAYVYDL